MGRVHLALVWHLHQPYYKDDLSGTYLLPWVRLRSTKDYLKMARLAQRHPQVAQTFNLVPSLLAQISDYSRSDPEDLFLALARRPAESLTPEERRFVVTWIRESPQFLRVQASVRYLELASRQAEAEFSTQDVRDLQVLSNLAWIDPDEVDRDPGLTALRIKDRDFDEADKEVLFQAQKRLVSQVVPTFSELARDGVCELTFSPFHHPILPLICHVDSARTALPGIPLPTHHFSHREDAEVQIREGRARFEAELGVHPAGMWPPEMAVGESVASLAIEAGVRWMISDEEVLQRSLETHFGRDEAGIAGQADLLYRPWAIEREGGRVDIVFRDSLLSNRIGFDYHRMPAGEAVEDFMGRLGRIAERQGEEDWLVVVALDGENAWDFYPREGHDFLELLYERLEASEDVTCTTVSGFLEAHPPQRTLPRLHTGSWIGACLDTWIGDSEHNRAWDLLAETRDWLERRTGEGGRDAAQLARAWNEIYIAEGSDWFWWFGEAHDSGMDELWDERFRLHLRNAYRWLEERPPPKLFEPILEGARTSGARQPRGAFTPEGRDDAAWEAAGRFESGGGFGALHKPAEVVDRLLFGADEVSLHLRLDSPFSDAELAARQIEFWLVTSGAPEEVHGSLAPPFDRRALQDLGFEPTRATRISARGASVHTLDSRSGRLGPASAWKIDSPSCFSIPWGPLGKSGGESLQLALVVVRAGSVVEVIPPSGSLALRAPGGERRLVGPAGPLKVLVVAAEMSPFARTGAIGDVTGQLARELVRLGHEVRAVIPCYRQVEREEHRLEEVATLEVPLGADSVPATVFFALWHGVKVYLVDQPSFYDRDQLYGFEDDDARFIYLSRAAVELMDRLELEPDVVHVHDWNTALVPDLLHQRSLDLPGRAPIATLLTVHNLAFQGTFGSASLRLAGLDATSSGQAPEYGEGQVNLLARGIRAADLVNTVSRRYAEEIQTPEFGEGLDELLRSHADKLHGVVNGIDLAEFDPRRDPHVAHHFDASDLEGKRQNRALLCEEMGLSDCQRPIAAFISRFYPQKGLELLEAVLPQLVRLDLDLVVLGAGERIDEDMFRRLAAQYPGRVAVTIGFDPALAHRIYAGADILLMPSRYEPCGIGQMIAMRYGTVPVVRFTGGLADTVEDYDPASQAGQGFVFRDFDPWQLFAAVVRAVEVHKDRRQWDALVRRAMAKDFSWRNSAITYADLYRAALAARAQGGQEAARGQAG